jgi:hypothetical protein
MDHHRSAQTDGDFRLMPVVLFSIDSRQILLGEPGWITQ